MTSERKFERKYDRRKVLEDEKSRIIVLRDFNISPPEVGIYEGEVRYFKANKEWCKFIFGWLTWMQDPAFWTDAQDSNYFAIQQILIFEEGITGEILMTPEELRDAIRDGNYAAWNRLAAQVVSGRYTDINVDEDGNVSQPSESGGDAGLPPDDPSTPSIDENLAARTGGCKAVTAGYNSIWADMLAWKTAGLSEDVISFRLQQKYQMTDDATTDIFVAGYFLDFPTGHINSYTETLSGMLFCGSGNFKNIVADYVIDSIAQILQETAFKLNTALSDAQITAWFAHGAQVPSTEYNTYSCTKIDDETFNLDMANANPVQYTTSGVWKAGHRYLIKVTGTYTDTDNPTLTGDGMYRHNSADGSKTFNSLSFNFGGSVTAPTQAQVPYEANHIYEFTVEKAVGSGNAAGIISKTDTTMPTPNRTGILTVTVKDLGEFAI